MHGASEERRGKLFQIVDNMKQSKKAFFKKNIAENYTCFHYTESVSESLLCETVKCLGEEQKVRKKWEQMKVFLLMVAVIALLVACGKNIPDGLQEDASEDLQEAGFAV